MGSGVAGHRRRRRRAGRGGVAHRHGITPAELVERSVPDRGIGPDGSLSRGLGEYAATVTVEDGDSARLTFRPPDGRIARSVPAAVARQFPGQTAELKSLVKQVRSTLAAECRRLESLLAESRTWPLPVWERHYASHPAADLGAGNAPYMLCRGTTDLIGGVVSVWRPVTFPLPPRPPPGRSMRRRYRR